MAESTPPSRARIDDETSSSVEEPPRSASSVDSRPSARRPLRLIDPPMRPTQPSHPPSEPRPIAGRPGADAEPDRPARVQLIAALLLLLVLVVVPLYLWRRPRAASTAEDGKTAASALAPAATTNAAPPDPAPHTKNGVTVSDPKVIGCHDPGSKRTSPDACDKLPGFEGAVSKAVLDASSCIPNGTPAGAIAFVVDASYARHHNPIRVRHRREDTTLPPKVVAACVVEVKKAIGSATLDQAHAHARYEIEIDATYAGKH